MKINITKTQLVGTPYDAWLAFCGFLRIQDVEYTPLQRTYALCFRYFDLVYNDGHAAFFESYGHIPPEEFARALTELGAPDFAEKLLDAAENGARYNYEKADAWFEDHADKLLGIIHDGHLNLIDEFFEIVDEDYEMRPPRGLAIIGAIEAALMIAMAIIFSITTPKDMVLIIITFSVIALPGLAIIFYCLCWKATVKKDILTVHRPFMPAKTININEISRLKLLDNRVVIYVNGKRAAAVNHAVSNYYLFDAQLFVAEKITPLDRNRITIRQRKYKTVGSIIVIVFIAITIFLNLPTEDDPVIFELIFFGVIGVIAIFYLYYCRRWRVSVTGNYLLVRLAFSEEKEILFNQVSKVTFDDRQYFIYVGEKKLVKIPFDCPGSATLAERLREAEVPFENKTLVQGGKKR